MLSIERTLILLSAFSLAVIVTSCDKNNDNMQDVAMVGWAAGAAHNGFGTIFHTSDGGNIWERQGDSLMIPDIFLQDIRAIDTNIVWACGESGKWLSCDPENG